MSNLNKIIISCESCGARFYVDNAEIHSSGRFVRCGVCEHEWLVTAQPNKPIANNIENKKEQSIVLVKKNRKHLYRFAILMASFILLIGLYYFDKFELPHDVKEMRKNWSQDVIIKDVEYKFSDMYETMDSLDHYKKFLLVTLSVENFANMPKNLEDVQIIALNQSKIQMMQVSVSPHQVVPPAAVFKMTIKVPLDRINPSYIQVIINKKRSKGRDLFNQSDRLIRIDASQN